MSPLPGEVNVNATASYNDSLGFSTLMLNSSMTIVRARLRAIGLSVSTALNTWGLIYNCCVGTKFALKEAYTTSYAKDKISKTNLTGKSVQTLTHAYTLFGGKAVWQHRL